MSTLKKIDPNSGLGVENSLAIFDLPPTAIAFNKTSVRELIPISTITQQGPYVFRIFPDNQFIDLSRTWMYLVTKLEKREANGTWVPLSNTTDDDKHTGVINNFGNSFIKQLKISINNVECSDSGTLYAYRSYIDHELTHSREYRKGISEAGCYYTDSEHSEIPGLYNDKGFKARVNRFSGGRECYTLSKLAFDLAQQGNLMLNNSDIIFTIYRNTDDFLIHTPNYPERTAVDPKDGTQQVVTYKQNQSTYRLVVVDIRLYTVCVDVVQSLQNAISKQLESVSAKYPMRRVEVRSVFLGKGRQHLTHNIFQTVIPRRVIVGFVKNQAFSGSRYNSPFLFEHANLRSICVEANGTSFPATPYQFDFERKQYVRGFVDMYQGLGLLDNELPISITMDKFSYGWTFFVIPLTSSLKDPYGTFEVIRNGTTVIKCTFNRPIADDGYDMVVFAEFDHILTINSDRVLSVDGSV